MSGTTHTHCGVLVSPLCSAPQVHPHPGTGCQNQPAAQETHQPRNPQARQGWQQRTCSACTHTHSTAQHRRPQPPASPLHAPPLPLQTTVQTASQVQVQVQPRLRPRAKQAVACTAAVWRLMSEQYHMHCAAAADGVRCAPAAAACVPGADQTQLPTPAVPRDSVPAHTWHQSCLAETAYCKERRQRLACSCACRAAQHAACGVDGPGSHVSCLGSSPCCQDVEPAEGRKGDHEDSRWRPCERVAVQAGLDGHIHQPNTTTHIAGVQVRPAAAPRQGSRMTNWTLVTQHHLLLAGYGCHSLLWVPHPCCKAS